MGCNGPPGARAVTEPPACHDTHSSHAGHQDVRTRFAVSNHSTALFGRFGFCQWPYLLPGGLMTPAMWPESASTNLIGPWYSWVAAEVDRNSSKIDPSGNGKPVLLIHGAQIKAVHCSWHARGIRVPIEEIERKRL